MPCMCGDICCPSCGPAQGNFKCPNCGVWDSDGGCEDENACEKANREIAEGEYLFYLLEGIMENLADRAGCSWLGVFDDYDYYNKHLKSLPANVLEFIDLGTSAAVIASYLLRDVERPSSAIGTPMKTTVELDTRNLRRLKDCVVRWKENCHAHDPQ